MRDWHCTIACLTTRNRSARARCLLRRQPRETCLSSLSPTPLVCRKVSLPTSLSTDSYCACTLRSDTPFRIVGAHVLVSVREHIRLAYHGEQPLFSSFLVPIDAPPQPSSGSFSSAPVFISLSSSASSSSALPGTTLSSELVPRTMSTVSRDKARTRGLASVAAPKRPRFVCWTCVARAPSSVPPDYAYNGVWSALCCISDYNRRLAGAILQAPDTLGAVRPITQIVWPDFTLVLGTDVRSVPPGWDARGVEAEAARQMAVALKAWLDRSASVVDDLAMAERRHREAFPSRDASDSRSRKIERLEELLVSGELMKRGLCGQEVRLFARLPFRVSRSQIRCFG